MGPTTAYILVSIVMRALLAMGIVAAVYLAGRTLFRRGYEPSTRLILVTAYLTVAFGAAWLLSASWSWGRPMARYEEPPPVPVRPVPDEVVRPEFPDIGGKPDWDEVTDQNEAERLEALERFRDLE